MTAATNKGWFLPGNDPRRNTAGRPRRMQLPDLIRRIGREPLEIQGETTTREEYFIRQLWSEACDMVPWACKMVLAYGAPTPVELARGEPKSAADVLDDYGAHCDELPVEELRDLIRGIEDLEREAAARGAEIRAAAEPLEVA